MKKIMIWMIGVIFLCTGLTVQAAEKDTTEEGVEMVYSDISSMVYQAGGWGVPQDESGELGNATEYKEAIANAEQLKAAIENTIRNEQSQLNVESFNIYTSDWPEVKKMFAKILNDNPELFYVSSEVSYTYYTNTGKLYTIEFYYDGLSKEQRQEMKDKLEQVASLVTDDMTDVEKALVLHDYLVQNCAYAYREYLDGTLWKTENVYSAYGALVEERSVCQGYALAYELMLSVVGIESDLCSSHNMNHAWNFVKIDGEWYHVDTTWDDPVWNTEGYSSHEYFLLSDAEMAERKHYDWEADYNCTSTKYDDDNYWWTQSKSRILLLNDKEYYLDAGYLGIQLIEKSGTNTTVKYENSITWPVWDGGGWWVGNFAYLSYNEGYLFFNDRLNLYAMKLDETTPQVVYTYDKGDAYIYGAMVYDDGEVRLNMSQSPNKTSDEYITISLKREKPQVTVDYAAGIFTTTTDMEYSIDGGKTWKACVKDMKISSLKWSGVTKYNMLFRTKASGCFFASDAVPVTVVQKVTGITLDKTELSINVGSSATLTATVSPTYAYERTVKWSSSNPSVVSVDQSGKVSALAVGSAVVTVTSTDGSGISMNCNITVRQPVTEIRLNKDKLSLQVEKTETLTAVVLPDAAYNKAVTWKSSNTAVATVDTNGKVTAVGAGTATVTATAKDGSGKSASCEVTVTQPVTGIQLDKSSISILKGKTATLTATVSPNNASNKTVTWKSSNTAVATVSSSGKVTAVAPGTATITVTAEDGSGKSATCKVTVTQPVTGITLNATIVNMKENETYALNATIKPDNAGNKAVTWKSSDTAVATVDTNGKITAVGAGTATVTATAKDGSGKKASCEVNVMSEKEYQVRAFVERMYTIVLGRAAEEQGLNDWATRLMAQEIDGATLVDMFVNSDEFINRNTSDEEYIKILYRAVLGREADADGLKMWKDMLADDWTRDYILEGLVLSTEFKTICDSYGIIAAFEPTAESQVRSFVKRMYTVVLNRRADVVGLDEWTQRLMNGTANGAQLADGFISSDEFVNRNLNNEKYVKVLYRAFFNREPDEGGFNVWMNELAKGASRREVMKGFVHSVEFCDLCAQYGIIRGEIQ